MSRIVVTGMGAVTPLGETVSDSWHRLIKGHEATAPVDLFDTGGCRCHRAATAALPSLAGFTPRALRRLPRASRLAIPAAREALNEAGLLARGGRSKMARLALSVSTTAGGMAFGEDFLRAVLAHRRAHLLRHLAGYLPQEQLYDLQATLGIDGPSIILANACASGANAIGHAFDLIATGTADCVLTGGFEALTELVYVGFDSLQAMTVEKCRPFDLHRSGLLLGEGAAFLVLESEDHARARGTMPICQIQGYGHSTDFFHLTQPQPEGHALIDAMKQAARQARLAPAEIGYINAHGTGTLINDTAEAAAYTSFLGDALADARISSTKAAIGHALGAAGAIEAVFAIQALRTQNLPTQLNLETPLPGMARALVERPEPSRPVRHAMSANLGFGGSNAALIFSQHEN